MCVCVRACVRACVCVCDDVGVSLLDNKDPTAPVTSTTHLMFLNLYICTCVRL